MTKEEKISSFDPNSWADKNANIFGLPFTIEESETVIIPVPWEVTVSYGGGTVNGPEAIFEASFQVDLYDPFVADAWKAGIAMEEIPEAMKSKSEILRIKAEKHIADLENGIDGDAAFVTEIEKGCEWMNDQVKSLALHHLKNKKAVCLVGGDHSTPLGMIRALGEIHDTFGILQIDAHADLRVAYEGFKYSHASIMYNTIQEPAVQRLVQVGIRDYCQDELEMINDSNGKIVTFFDREIKQQQYQSVSWNEICEKIVDRLPQKVYLSFDIDGLDPKLCPNTGTPVAGGFETDQILFLMEKVVESGRVIIGMDLNEVSPAEDNDWDANVAARVLFRLCNLMARSQGKV